MFAHLFGIHDIEALDYPRYLRFKAYADRHMSGGG